MNDFTLLRRYKDQIRELKLKITSLKQGIKTTTLACPKCGNTVMSCGHNSPRGCIQKKCSSQQMDIPS